jgi:uncharacterized protein YbbK (DUF523 family)
VRILITGSQLWTDVDRIRTLFTHLRFNPDVVTMVSGHCPRGADRMCEDVAAELGWAIERHPANWELYGKRAGYIRNAEMVRLGADICLAFIKNESPGSTNTAMLARTAGIQTYIFKERTPGVGIEGLDELKEADGDSEHEHVMSQWMNHTSGPKPTEYRVCQVFLPNKTRCPYFEKRDKAKA